MSSLIASTTASRGQACNARCYNAKRRECHCRCCGINHGVGAVHAQQNTREIGISSLRAATIPNLGRRKPTVPREQGELFPSG
jgi:hypothetical protein